MRLVVFTILCMHIVHVSYAQCTPQPKLQKLYDAKDYNKCIVKAEKAKDKLPQAAEPLAYIAFSNFALFVNSNDKNARADYLKNALMNTFSAYRKDKNGQCLQSFSDTYKQLHDSALAYARSVFKSPQRNKSELYFDYVAKIWNDTTMELRYLMLPDDRRNDTLFDIVTSDTVNRTDMDGLKQGTWIKMYPNGKPAYRFYFVDDKPLGECVRYTEGGNLYVSMRYNRQGNAFTTFYYVGKKKMSEGMYKGKQKDSVWRYYTEQGALLREETFKNGKLNGAMRIFYPDGVTVAEETEWQDSVQVGKWRKYYPSGKLKYESQNSPNGKRNGVVKVYFPNGELEMIGTYKDNVREGKWTYYDASGKQTKQITYINGKAQNADQLDAEETEELKELDKNQDKIKDPDKFRNNPDNYFGN